MNRKTIWAWCSYDFGNSSFAVLFPLFFGTFYAGTVVGGDSGDFWWGLTISVSMACVALSAPLMGGIADHAGVRKKMLWLYTLLGIAAVLGFLGIEKGMVVRGFALGVIANFAFEGGIVFYNSYLPDIAPTSHQGRVSAYGFALGYFGSLIALVLAALLTHAGLFVWVWVALALQWACGAAPAFAILPKDERSDMSVVAAAREGVRRTFATWKAVLGMRNLRRFLLAYFFYMDGVNTVISFAARYGQKELHIEQTELVLIYMMVQVTALAGSLLMGRPTDTKGPKWAVQVLLIWWTGVVVATFFTYTALIFWIVAGLAGLGIGGIQASSRAFMARMIPDGREAELFGFYALCGKTGAIIGPLLFGSLTVAFGSARPAVLSVAAFYAIGYLLLKRVRLPAASSQ